MQEYYTLPGNAILMNGHTPGGRSAIVVVDTFPEVKVRLVVPLPVHVSIEGVLSDRYVMVRQRFTSTFMVIDIIEGRQEWTLKAVGPCSEYIRFGMRRLWMYGADQNVTSLSLFEPISNVS